MKTLMSSIVNNVVKELEGIDSAEGLVVFGSFARGEVDSYSDLDMMAYLSDDACDSSDYETVRDSILRVVEKADGGLLFSFGGQDKHIAYTKNQLLSVEFRIRNLRQMPEDAIFVKESRVDAPEKSVVLDRRGLVAERSRKSWDNLRTNDAGAKFDEYMYGFLYYYDGFRTQMARGDAYRAYMNYTIALYKLASLCTISKGERANLYQPWFLLEKVMGSRSDVDMLIASSSTMKPQDMWERKDMMIALFKRIVGAASEKLHLTIDMSVAEEFLEDWREVSYNGRGDG